MTTAVLIPPKRRRVWPLVSASVILCITGVWSLQGYRSRSEVKTAASAAIHAVVTGVRAPGVTTSMRRADEVEATRFPWGDFRTPYRIREMRAYGSRGSLTAIIAPRHEMYVLRITFGTGRDYRVEAARGPARDVWSVRIEPAE